MALKGPIFECWCGSGAKSIKSSLILSLASSLKITGSQGALLHAIREHDNGSLGRISSGMGDPTMCSVYKEGCCIGDHT